MIISTIILVSVREFRVLFYINLDCWQNMSVERFDLFPCLPRIFITISDIGLERIQTGKGLGNWDLECSNYKTVTTNGYLTLLSNQTRKKLLFVHKQIFRMEKCPQIQAFPKKKLNRIFSPIYWIFLKKNTLIVDK